jgi:hypothetical protein
MRGEVEARVLSLALTLRCELLELPQSSDTGWRKKEEGRQKSLQKISSSNSQSQFFIVQSATVA